jgi:hypothetical protein
VFEWFFVKFDSRSIYASGTPDRPEIRLSMKKTRDLAARKNAKGRRVSVGFAGQRMMDEPRVK